MKRQPIVKAKWKGCANCSTTPTIELSNDDKIQTYDFIYLMINDRPIKIDDVTVAEFLNQNVIKSDDLIEIFYMSAFHDETYELDTSDMKFKLVEQGRGYA